MNVSEPTSSLITYPSPPVRISSVEQYRKRSTSLSTVFSNALQGVTVNFTVNRCTFNGTAGTVSATLALTSQIVFDTAYRVTYTYN
jgi:hypothetical protein